VIWIGALLCFYLPFVLAIVELSSRYPQEGRLYVWTKQAFGPYVGFMAGWSYFSLQSPLFPQRALFRCWQRALHRRHALALSAR